PRERGERGAHGGRPAILLRLPPPPRLRRTRDFGGQAVGAGVPFPLRIYGSLTPTERRTCIMPEPERNIGANDRGNDPAPSSSGTGTRGKEGGEASPPGGGVIGALMTPVTMVAALIAAFVSDLWRDRALAAFGRQGLDELGTAMKAFPDSIQVD